MKTRKNVLIIMTDEQRWDTIGCHGNDSNITPNIDALVENGVSMNNAYTANPLCCPARASLWTGLMPHDHHVIGNWRSISPNLKNDGLVKNFKKAGYHTVYTGKWHVPGTTPNNFHFDDTSAIPAVLDGKDRGRYIEPYREYVRSKGYQLIEQHIENLTKSDLDQLTIQGKAPCGKSEIKLEHYLETWQTEQFLDALDRMPSDQPFFAVCSYNAPHFPMIVPEPYDTLVPPEEVRLPANFRKGLEGKGQELKGTRYDRLADLDESEWRKLYAHYLGFCALMDDQVGKIIKYLRENDIYEETIIVFLSDHGDMMGSHGLIEKGFSLHYEEALRVPLIISNIGKSYEKHNESLVSLIDLLPTLAELTGVSINQACEGKSFAKLLRNENSAPIREYVFAESFLVNGSEGGDGEHVNPNQFHFETDSVNFSIRTKNFKYLFRYNNNEELYDLQEDPYETTNLVSKEEVTTQLEYMRGLLLHEVKKSNSRIENAVIKKLNQIKQSQFS